jgi:hypothetical protein
MAIHVRTEMAPSLADEMKDLELMLAPLRRLPGLGGIGSEVEPYLKPRPEPLEVQLSLELDPREPTVDFVRQLFELAYQLSTSGGIAIPRGMLIVARRFLKHAETVADAWWAESTHRQK